MDSALNMENMPLASTAIRTCFWGYKWFWLDRNGELSRPFHFPGLTRPCLLITSSKMTLNFFSPVSLIQIFPEQELKLGKFSDPVSECVWAQGEGNKVICNLALEGERLSGARDCFCYCCLALNHVCLLLLSCPLTDVQSISSSQVWKETWQKLPEQEFRINNRFILRYSTTSVRYLELLSILPGGVLKQSGSFLPGRL